MLRCFLLLFLSSLLVACPAGPGVNISQVSTATPQMKITVSPTDKPTSVGVTTPVLPPLPTLTVAPTATSIPDLEGTQPCQRPPDDMSRVNFKDQILNARTLWMLRLTDTIYTGRGDPMRVTQGSYTDGEDLSFGTHRGGGAVDISIRVKSNPSDLLNLEESDALVRALRSAGFAAWLRLPEDITPSVPLHIHAIAVGDQDLSTAALQQLTGPEGYFRGLDGVPPEFGGSHQDRHGGPVLCDWMREMGFADLR